MRIRETKVFFGGASMEKIIDLKPGSQLVAAHAFNDLYADDYVKIFEKENEHFSTLLTQVPYHGTLILEAIEDNNDSA